MMKPRLDDPYRAVVKEFSWRGVRYVVVGMSGINYYARNPAETFATLDYDLFLDPTLSNVEKALQGLGRLGFTVGTSAGPLNEAEVTRIVRDRVTLVASTPDGVTIELLLEISGYAFSDLAKDAATFTVRGVPIRVGRLAKLLKSKQLAGRPKDRHFLQRYRTILEGESRRSLHS